MMNTQVCVTRRGFTLIEILIAIAIIAVVGAIVAPQMFSNLLRGRDTSTRASLRALKLVISTYNMDTNSYPDSLRDLIRKPRDEQVAKKWKHGYLESNELPMDGWGNPFYYKKPGEGHPYDLSSYGEHGKGSPKSEWISVWNL